MRSLVVALLAAGCISPLAPPPSLDPGPALEIGESREAVVRHLRLEVEGFEKSVDLDALQRLPPSVRDGLWLLDVPLDGLVRNALDGLSALSLQEARQLPPSAQNMRTLLRSTPDNAILEGTNLEEMVALSAALGIPPGRVLSELLEVQLTEPVIAVETATDVLVEQLISTHPATWSRMGPVDDDHPDGVYDVAPGHLPVTLGDVVTGFSDLATRFGPADTPLGRHPGFIDRVDAVSVVEDAFEMTVKVDGNALPYRGLDLTDVSGASVNSTPSQIDTLFPLDDPDWLRIEGLVDDPTMEALTIRIVEDEVFHEGGTSREPTPTGDSTAWSLDPWVYERLLAEMAYRTGQDVSEHCVSRTLGTGTVAFDACVDPTGWTTFTTFDGLGAPPAPAYLWDLVLELSQVRLHDGGLAEGAADIALTLQDVSLGLTADQIVAETKANLAANPIALQALAAVLTENSTGAADVVYVRDGDTDWLWFVHPSDLPPEDAEGARTYDYARPGFWADEDLSERVSDTTEVAGDRVHDKVAVVPGDVLHVEDDAGRVYRLDVSDKPSRARLELTVTRVR